MFISKEKHEAAIQEKQEIIDGLNTEKNQLSESLSTLKGEKTQLENDLKSEQDAHQETKNTLETANKDIARLNGEIEELKKNAGSNPAVVTNDTEVPEGSQKTGWDLHLEKIESMTDQGQKVAYAAKYIK